MRGNSFLRNGEAVPVDRHLIREGKIYGDFTAFAILFAFTRPGTSVSERSDAAKRSLYFKADTNYSEGKARHAAQS